MTLSPKMAFAPGAAWGRYASPLRRLLSSHTSSAKALRFDRATGRFKGEDSPHNPYLAPYTEEADSQIRTTITVATVCAKLGKLSRQKIEGLTPQERTTLYTAVAQLRSASRLAVSNVTHFGTPCACAVCYYAGTIPPPSTQHKEPPMYARLMSLFLLSILTLPAGACRTAPVHAHRPGAGHRQGHCAR